MRVNEYSGLDALGREFWVVDENGSVAIKAACQPFTLSPGYRVELTGPFVSPQMRTPKRPGFLSSLGQANRGFWEVLSPGGGVVAAFRCRPFFLAPGLALKRVDQIRRTETLVEPGAAQFPEGTVRRRMGPLRTHRR